MSEELNKSLDILELERIKEILPDYIHKNIKDMPPLTESLNYLFKEEIDYKSIINEEIRSQIEDLIKSNEENKGVYEFKSISDNQKFYIQDDNLVIYFDLYEIAPYAAGIPEFMININKIDHILKPEYKEIFK